MRTLSLVLTLPVLAAPAPVDYDALAKTGAEIRAALKAAWEAAHKQGQKDWRSPAAEALVKGVADAAEQCQGEARHARLLLVAKFWDLPGYEQAWERVRDEVPPASPAWQLCVEIAPFVGRIPAFKGTDYVARLQAEGIPEVRREVLAGQVEEMLILKGDLAQAQLWVDQLQRDHPGSKAAGKAAKALDRARRTAPGQAAVPFSVRNLEHPEQRITLADFKGKYLLLDFWGTWCGWCVKELPTTHKLYEAYKDKGLEILSLSTDKDPAEVTRFRARPESPMPWKHAWLNGDPEARKALEQAYGVSNYPSLFLVGPDGRILAKGEDLREEKLAETLANLIVSNK